MYGVKEIRAIWATFCCWDKLELVDEAGKPKGGMLK